MFQDIEALVFDFDGTLVDASEAICRSFNAALEKYGASTVSDQQIRRLIGKPLKDMFPIVLPGLDDTDIRQLIDLYRDVFLPIAADLSKPMPGLYTMCAHFRPRVKMAIATSRLSDGAHHILKALKLTQYFDTVVGLQDVRHPKPDPEPVLTALRRVGVAPADAVMIGDVPADMQAGRDAGTGNVGILSELYPSKILLSAGADSVIHSLDELIDLISTV